MASFFGIAVNRGRAEKVEGGRVIVCKAGGVRKERKNRKEKKKKRKKTNENNENKQTNKQNKTKQLHSTGLALKQR